MQVISPFKLFLLPALFLLGTIGTVLAQDQQKPFIELVKVGDDEIVSKGFTLSHDTRIRIHCLGEGTEEEMFDYGWIIDADSRETVWTMKIEATEHAGGADKNRVIDTELALRKGNYIAYYATDESHSYFDWNDIPPDNKDEWGITIQTVNASDGSSVTLFNESDFKSADVIAEIVRLKDNDFQSKEFTLDKDTKVKIYAIGEGTKGGMADYGWIENDATGKAIWTMTYKKTDHAGGAAKNRKTVEVVSLPKGKYRVYYETDPSHSYKDWNANPPDDQERYGITLFYDKSADIN